MDDYFAELYFDVQRANLDYRNAVEDHVRGLRRLIQAYDHLAPHELDGASWDKYLRSQAVIA